MIGYENFTPWSVPIDKVAVGRQSKETAVTRRALTQQGIEQAIHVVRGCRVMIDADLARLYGVETGALNRAVKRNRSRFPADFMFQLTRDEAANLRCQIGISRGHGGRRGYYPYAFTQEGVAMLSSVLSSKQAIEVNVEIMRVFVRMRRAIAFNADFAHRLAAVEASLNEHRALTGKALAEHERHIRMVLEALKQLMDQAFDEPQEPPSRIGFEIAPKAKRAEPANPMAMLSILDRVKNRGVAHSGDRIGRSSRGRS